MSLLRRLSSGSRYACRRLCITSVGRRARDGFRIGWIRCVTESSCFIFRLQSMIMEVACFVWKGIAFKVLVPTITAFATERSLWTVEDFVWSFSPGTIHASFKSNGFFNAPDEDHIETVMLSAFRSRIYLRMDFLIVGCKGLSTTPPCCKRLYFHLLGGPAFASLLSSKSKLSSFTSLSRFSAQAIPCSDLSRMMLLVSLMILEGLTRLFKQTW